MTSLQILNKKVIKIKHFSFFCQLSLSFRLAGLLLFFFLCSCANQLAPPGGEVDKIPPKIEYVYPAQGTVNFDKDYIEIKFSEYVDKRSVQEALFISPYIEKTLEYEWTGTTVTITFPEELKKDLTYSITIGTDVVDLNNRNRMSESYSFAFSTGAKIDTKEISGRIYGKDREGILIYAFRLNGDADTLLHRKPDYVSQSGLDGNFSLKGLASGDYRIFAVRDNFRDLVFQSEQDEIGIPFRDITLDDMDTSFINLKFLIFNADTSVTRLVSSIMTDSYHILLTFSGEINPTMIKPDNFYLFDSTSFIRKNIKYAYKGRTKPEEMVLVIDESIPPENRYYLFADSIVNLRGYVFENDFSSLTVSDKPDTIPPNIVSTIPAINSTVDFIKPEIKFIFDDAFASHNIKEGISFADTLGKNISFDISHPDNGTILIKAIEDLKPEKDYIIKIDLNNIVDAAGNKSDSLYIFRFKTISGMDFTGTSGKIINIGFGDSPVLVLENTSDKNIVYKKNVTTEAFEFSRIEPGKYFLWCFLDLNKDGEFNYGWPEPFNYSEGFSFHPDTLNIRARWEVTDIIFNYK